MKKTTLTKWLAVAGVLLAFQHAAFAADELLLRAKKLIDSKKASQAYALLSPLESTRAGDAEYDYLLGIAALDSGKPTEAMFALERVLFNNPDNAPARLEFARAHLMAGDSRTARKEFEAVKKQRPPEQVKQTIQKYLGAIDLKESEERTKIRAYIEVAAGRDTNANSATANSQIAIPFFGGAIATLTPSSMSASDNFLSATAGASVRHMLTPEWILNASANIGQRQYSQLNQYDIGNIDATTGLTRLYGADQFSGALQYQKIFVDRASYRQTVGVMGQWQHNFDDTSQIVTYGQAMRQAYTGVQQIRDVNRYVLGAAYSQAFAVKYFPVAYVGLYAGKELPLQDNVPQLANDFTGLRVGGQLTLAPSVILVANASFEERRYRGKEIAFLVERNDRQTDLSLALNYMPLAGWTIRPEISRTRASSNIVINDYSRTQFSIAVRREF
ncbi:MAG: DUF560 domain-containing protein [Proteobacteria bacterium]|nr:DUF560 domain-containing protein [Pseudomonadota bacterium]